MASEKFLNTGKWSGSSWEIISKVLLEILHFYHWQQILSIVRLVVSGLPCFEEMSAKYPSLFIICASFHGIWKFSGQGLKLCHGSNPNHCSDNDRSLSCCVTRERLAAACSNKIVLFESYCSTVICNKTINY